MEGRFVLSKEEGDAWLNRQGVALLAKRGRKIAALRERTRKGLGKKNAKKLETKKIKCTGLEEVTKSARERELKGGGRSTGPSTGKDDPGGGLLKKVHGNFGVKKWVYKGDVQFTTRGQGIRSCGPSGNSLQKKKHLGIIRWGRGSRR